MTETGFSSVFFTCLLFVLFGGIILAQRFFPRLSQRLQSIGKLQTLGMLTLTPQCSVAVVRAGRETLVLGLTPHSVTLLTKTYEVDVVEEQRQSEPNELGPAVTGEARAAL
jgi:flagellar biogenesis protein FliO